MKCEKHVNRRRKDCIVCFPENNIEGIKQNEQSDKVEESSKNPIVEKIEETKIESKKIEVPSDIEDYFIFKIEQTKKELDEILSIKLKELSKDISRSLTVKYESLDILLTRFNMKVLDSLLSDGWSLVSILTKDVAKVSGFKDDTTIFQRVKSPLWKKTVEQYKELYKESKNGNK